MSRQPHQSLNKPANPDASLARWREAVAKVKAMTISKPSFIIHTGGHHASFQVRPNSMMPTGIQREPACQFIGCPAQPTSSYEERGKAYLERYGKGSRGAGWSR
jgi:hypothetical protein